ncbi:MAG: glycosyltransferase [Armatimonadetes bacterium]|nr:glycosyltransferase [Armatimonadota bacterium]
MSKPIFFDPKGRRQKLLSRGVLAAIAVSAVLGAGFTVSVLIPPLLPQLPGVNAEAKRRSFIPTTQSKLSEKAQVLLAKSKAQLAERIAAEKPPTALRARGEPIVAAYYAPWQETGLHSLEANASKITDLLPEWLHLSPDGRELDQSDFDPEVTPHNVEVIQIARANGIRIVPILNNASMGAFDPERAHKLLSNPELQKKIASDLRTWLLRNRYQGIQIDFENLHKEDAAVLPSFLGVIQKEFTGSNLGLTAALELTDSPLPFKAIAEACNWVTLMLYDQHAQEDEPGPIASIDWVEQNLEDAKQQIPEHKLVMGIANYSYDWAKGAKTAESLTYQEAIAAAKGYRDSEPPQDVIDFDAETLNPHFEYDDDQGVNHQVWMTDAASAYNQWRLGWASGIRGTALWALGSEDPSMWLFYDRNKLGKIPSATVLQRVTYPYEVDFSGKGEVMEVAQNPAPGTRSLEVDTDGEIVDESYSVFPSPIVIKRSGYKPKTVALTFDDGPDGTYTAPILDKLKELDVPATFFVIGKNAEQSPELVRRMVAEGHEVGSHTFSHPNLGLISPDRAELEINTSQRAIQAILGRSTILFRPPYNADAEPTSPMEVEPVRIAARLGYLTIGELIDPQDWLLEYQDDAGRVHERSPELMARIVMQEVARGEGNVILLHDGGGEDRSRTLQVLDIIVPQLRAQGYRFVGVSELVGVDRDRVMPLLSRKDVLLVGLDRLVFDFVFNADALLAVLFVFAIGLGIARIGLIVPLAALHEWRRKDTVREPFEGKVSALIAAYNEEKVIVATVQSILASTFPVHQVVVVDDGSKDETLRVLSEAFAAEPRVLVIHQENAGKAAALNRALKETDADVVVCIDADTQLNPDAVGLMASHFNDPQIASVAGNVLVGNVHNLLTLWQHIEYTASQNLDRRAYALLNAITVVPGAIGAWRREAVLAVGGYSSDTLAEDMDLTWRLREAGYRLETEPDAKAHTEAPDTVKTFFKQRFRWAYGTLQCLWKHRRSVGKHGYFGRLALPALWVFQIGFQAIAPLIDLQMIVSVAGFASTWYTHHYHPSEYDNYATATSNLRQVLELYGLFFVIEYLTAWIAFKMDRLKSGGLWTLLVQRFFYRQLMYAVIYRSLLMALAGVRQGWGKLDRKASVRISQT